jgi:hypothetical protein
VRLVLNKAFGRFIIWLCETDLLKFVYIPHIPHRVTSFSV